MQLSKEQILKKIKKQGEIVQQFTTIDRNKTIEMKQDLVQKRIRLNGMKLNMLTDTILNDMK